MKVFDTLLDSTVWDTPQATRLVWITMLVMADRDGYVGASVPGLAKRAGVERGECERALALFMAPDVDSRTKEHEGRRIVEADGGWTLLNYEKYRDRASSAEKRAKDAARQKRKYDRDKEAHGKALANALTRETHASSRVLTEPRLSVSAADADSSAVAVAPRGAAPAEVTAADVCKVWNDSAAGMALHGLTHWQSDFDSIAHAVNAHPKVKPESRRLALTGLCEWVWQASDGPRSRCMLPDPGMVAKRVSSDLLQARKWYVARQEANRVGA